MPNKPTSLEVSLLGDLGAQRVKPQIHSLEWGMGIKCEEDPSGVEDRNMYLLSAKPFTPTTAFDLERNSVKLCYHPLSTSDELEILIS